MFFLLVLAVKNTLLSFLRMFHIVGSFPCEEKQKNWTLIMQKEPRRSPG